MAHGGEKLAFGAVGRFGAFLGFAEGGDETVVFQDEPVEVLQVFVVARRGVEEEKGIRERAAGEGP